MSPHVSDMKDDQNEQSGFHTTKPAYLPNQTGFIVLIFEEDVTFSLNSLPVCLGMEDDQYEETGLLTGLNRFCRAFIFMILYL